MNSKPNLKHTIPIIFSGIALLLLTCAREYNPFDDASNAGVIVKKMSFTENGALEIFSAESITVYTTVRELLDSFSVHLEKNRFWKDTVIRHNRLEPQHLFTFSIYDTGKQSIRITGYAAGKKTAITTISFTTVSPLKQDTIEAGVNIPVDCKASAVSDRDVFYNWDFGDSIRRYSIHPVKRCTLTIDPDVTTGWMWVCDQNHAFSSPKVPFIFYLKDLTAPYILCENRQNHDTIASGDSSLLMRFRIFDRYNNAIVDSASVNGHTFDNSISAARLYFCTIHDLYRYSSKSPYKATIFARDNKDFHNDTVRTFYFYYDSTLNQSTDTRITIYNITGDSTISFHDTLFPVLGRINSISSQKRILKTYVNGALNQSFLPFPSGNGEWQWLLNLKPLSINTIRIEAEDTGGKVQAAETLSIYHTDMLGDNEKPVIAGISVTGAIDTMPDSFFTALYSAQITIVAYDKQSLVGMVLVNGANATQENDRLRWTFNSFPLTHQAAGNTVIIEARDKTGNLSKKTVTIFQNSPPALRLLTPFPQYLFVDTSYTASYIIEDMDVNDRVDVKILSVWDSLTLNPANNTITWRPQKADTGKKTLVLALDDRYPRGMVNVSWNVVVRARPLPPVRFRTTSNDLEDSLVFRKDTLTDTLHLLTNTGNPPYTFSIRNITSGKFLVQSTRDSAFFWAPSYTDLCNNRLLFTVRDSLGGIDTFSHPVTVVYKDLFPCSLVVKSPQGILQNNSVFTVQSSTDTTILTCILRDKDSPVPELFTITQQLDTASIVFTTSDTVFYYTIIPKGANKKETLFLSVFDASGVETWFTLYIRHPSHNGGWFGREISTVTADKTRK